MNFWSIQLLNGLSLAMVLFLLSAGLSVIFGLMRIINLAHGSFYLIGGYIGLTVIERSGSFWFGLAIAPILVGLLGVILQRLLLRRVQHDELSQVLLSFGVLLVCSDVALTLWGGLPQTLPRPEALDGTIKLGTIVFPMYRMALSMAGIAVAVILWLLLGRTKVGARVRASVDDEEMARGIGINTGAVFAGVFGLGAALAGMAGVLGGAMLGVYPGADFDVILLAFAVVVIGGLGSLRGALVGSLFIGIANTLGNALMPQFALFTVFVPMVAMLAFRPSGFFGRS
ncbi:MAG TPA: branched-chain amino acid ABC transporter permease [Stellaceae bacterium]|nr:branched-chain amino acid ABC transporter permease [Stellaceae bacterium]